jgi:hypothetical protein
MNRIDVYTMAHKGLRSLLFEAAALAARTDFSSDEETARLAAKVEALLGWLDSHAEHEELAIMPELAVISPDLHAALSADHGKVAGVQADVRGWVARMRSSAGPARVAVGPRLHERLLALTAEHVRHMGTEEADANRMLWAHRTDDELRAMVAKIRAATPPGRVQGFLSFVLPALNPAERVAMLAPIASSVPRPVLEDLVAPARTALGAEWDRTAAALGW